MRKALLLFISLLCFGTCYSQIIPDTTLLVKPLSGTSPSGTNYYFTGYSLDLKTQVTQRLLFEYGHYVENLYLLSDLSFICIVTCDTVAGNMLDSNLFKLIANRYLPRSDYFSAMEFRKLDNIIVTDHYSISLHVFGSSAMIISHQVDKPLGLAALISSYKEIE